MSKPSDLVQGTLDMLLLKILALAFDTFIWPTPGS